MNILEVENLSFSYSKSPILENVNLTIDEGEFVTISGANGSGKSTLIKLILGQLERDIGSIKLFDSPLEKFNDFEKIGYVPQVREASELSFPITSREYVVLNLYKSFNKFKRPTRNNWLMVDSVLKSLNIIELRDIPVNKLSGGQAQRVMIARALVNNPEFLILDEPTVGIDKKSKDDLINLLIHINQNHKKTILMISHESDFNKKLGAKNVKLKDGELKYA
jgi:ABC superfamily ATP binding cassette transporter, ABC protein